MCGTSASADRLLVVHEARVAADELVERFFRLPVAKAMNLGASGAITGLANIAPDLMKPLIDGIEEPRVNAMVEAVLPFGVTAAVKALVGHRRKDPMAWSRMRAPLKSLGEAECVKLFATIDAIRARRAA